MALLRFAKAIVDVGEISAPLYLNRNPVPKRLVSKDLPDCDVWIGGEFN